MTYRISSNTGRNDFAVYIRRNMVSDGFQDKIFNLNAASNRGALYSGATSIRRNTVFDSATTTVHKLSRLLFS